MAYASTPNKQTIRHVWDRALLKRWSEKAGRRLTYFGLPGPEIHDFVDWVDLLDSQRTAVESPGRTRVERETAAEAMGRMSSNVLVHGISSGFQLLRSDVEDIIIDGVDADGNPPQLNDGKPAHLRRFGYDFVNLDFDGGLGYRDKQGAARRIAALRRLFHRQEEQNFLLFLTVNVRHTLGLEVEEYLKGLQERNRDSQLSATLEWYLRRGSGELEYKLKAAVPCFIHAVAHPCRFRSICRPPVVYTGYRKAKMLHFVFEFTSHPSNFPAFSPQDDLDLVSLPLIRCEDGQLLVPPMQHPGFQLADAWKSMDFLTLEYLQQLGCTQ